MEHVTYLTNCLTNFGTAAQYDAEAKKIVADKGLLAMILKEAVKELREYERSEVKIIINLEIQKEFLKSQQMPRGIYYCCRNITGQKDREFEGEDYAGIKKTYGIWLNLNAPRREADSTFCVELRPRVMAGDVDPEEHRYDLMNVTMIGLDDESYARRATELHGYLGTIFTTKLSPQEKIRILQEEYGVEPTKEVKEGVGKMCNLGEALVMETWEKAMKEAEKEIAKVEMKVEAEKNRAEAEKNRAEAAETRANQAEKELEELKNLLNIQ